MLFNKPLKLFMELFLIESFAFAWAVFLGSLDVFGCFFRFFVVGQFGPKEISHGEVTVDKHTEGPLQTGDNGKLTPK